MVEGPPSTACAAKKRMDMDPHMSKSVPCVFFVTASHHLQVNQPLCPMNSSPRSFDNGFFARLLSSNASLSCYISWRNRGQRAGSKSDGDNDKDATHPTRRMRFKFKGSSFRLILIFLCLCFVSQLAKTREADDEG